MNDLLIRDVRPEEMELVYRMGLDTFQNPAGPDWGWTLEYLRLLLDPAFGFCHVAELARRIVGIHCGVWNYPESSETRCRMYWIFVDPAFRKQGIADDLLEHALRAAAERGKEQVYVGIWEGDERAACFVRRHGFAPATTLVLYRKEVTPLPPP